MRRIGLALLLLAPPAVADPVRPGPTADGGTLVVTRQLLHPAGTTLVSGGHPLDLALAPDGKTLFVVNDWSVFPVDTKTMTMGAQLWYGEGGASQHGIAVTPTGKRLFVSVTENTLLEVLVKPDGALDYGRYLALPGPGGEGASYPTGVALSADTKTAWVCLSRNNTLAALDLITRSVTGEVKVGVAPYAVVLAPDGRTAWVSNWGGRHPGPTDLRANSAGTEALVDGRGVAASGSVSLVELGTMKELAEVETGLHPAGLALAPDGKRLYVACANADTVVVIDTATRAVVETIPVRPDPALPYGSAPNALALSPDARTLYVANGGNNALAVVALGAPSRVTGFIPTGWFPGAVATDGRALYVANVKGLGNRNADARKDAAKKDPLYRWGWTDGMYQGSVNRIPVPAPAALPAMTRRVRQDGQVPAALAAHVKAQAGRKAVPVPAHPGEPSVFEHVVYVIKENRTYDQVLGDLKTGNGEPKLCVYGRAVTPNQHALAEQFVLLDNYYCNGVLSSDGHPWAVEGNVSAYLEKAHGGWVRTYDFGTDPLAFSCSGPIWEAALARGLSFRNYGEIDNATVVPDSAGYLDVYRDWQAHAGKVTFGQRLPMAHLKSFSCPAYPGWNLRIPDQVRADAFLKELKAAEAAGTWPNLVVIYLPQNHTSGTKPGTPTPRAMVADNDLALGRIVAAISASTFWARTCIFVEEDDPQDGFDHVDGHRSPCLVISPYSRLRRTVSAFYNQTSVLHTMERIMGLAPLTQFTAMAPVMSACFGSTPNLAAFRSLPNTVPLDEMNPEKKALAPADRRWAAASERMDFSRPDAIDEDRLNRVLWAAARSGEPYPAAWAGAHGRGLKALGLTLAPEADED